MLVPAPLCSRAYSAASTAEKAYMPAQMSEIEMPGFAGASGLPVMEITPLSP